MAVVPFPVTLCSSWSVFMRISMLMCGSLLAAALTSAHPATPASPSQTWDALADEYFDQVFFKFSPTSGTAAGLHQFDTQLEDYSRAGIDRQIAALHAFEKRIAFVDPRDLNETNAGDREILLSNIRGTLLELETIRPWEKNPDAYSSGVTNSIYVIMSRKFASPDDRLRSVIARELQIPSVFAEAKKNLANPPRIFTEVALEQLPGIIAFFQSDVPTAFAAATDTAGKSEFAKSNAAVVAVLEDYEKWLKSDLLARSNGDFRIGAETFSKKLLCDEMVDTPLDRLVEIGMADLHRNQEKFNRIAKDVDPGKTPVQVLEQLGATHPAPNQLLQSFRDTFDSLINFIHEKHIVTVPSPVKPIVQETPPFLRALTTASMDTPGPFERVASEAFFNVTLPAPGDAPEAVAGRMAAFNRGTIVSTAVHEAYPGHYIQFLWTPMAISKVRKLLGANSNAEGWAHYCEQMMLDEGYGQPGVGAANLADTRLIQLGQLQDALLRDARFIVGLQMHRGKMTFDQGIDFFVKEGYQTHQSGLTETKRGTSDPTYLYYTLGKIEILKLREDVQKKQGPAFSLQKFHDDFLRQGFPAIKIVRKAMLGDDSPAL
jgi:uncharacterized protein (DUF885 family)